MSNTYSVTTSNGIMLAAGASPVPSSAPKGLIVTRAVEVKDGWTGQVVVAEEIVREKVGFATAEKAERWATSVVTKAIKGLFT